MMVEVVIIILHSDTTILNPHHHGSLFAWSTIHISCEQPTTRSEDYVHGVLHHQHCKIHLATSSQNTLCCLPLFLRHHRRTYIHCTPPVLSLHAQVGTLSTSHPLLPASLLASSSSSSREQLWSAHQESLSPQANTGERDPS